MDQSKKEQPDPNAQNGNKTTFMNDSFSPNPEKNSQNAATISKKLDFDNNTPNTKMEQSSENGQNTTKSQIKDPQLESTMKKEEKNEQIQQSQAKAPEQQPKKESIETKNLDQNLKSPPKESPVSKKSPSKKKVSRSAPTTNDKRIIFQFDFEAYEYDLDNFNAENVGNRCTVEELNDIFQEVYQANDDYEHLKKLFEQRRQTLLFGALVFIVFLVLWVVALIVQDDIGPFFVFSILGFLYGITIIGQGIFKHHKVRLETQKCFSRTHTALTRHYPKFTARGLRLKTNKKTNISWIELEKETNDKFDVPPPSRKKIRKNDTLSSIPLGGLRPPFEPRLGQQWQSQSKQQRESMNRIMFHRGSFSSNSHLPVNQNDIQFKLGSNDKLRQQFKPSGTGEFGKQDSMKSSDDVHDIYGNNNNNEQQQQQQGNMASSNFVVDPFNKPLGNNNAGGYGPQQQGNMASSNFVQDPFNKPLGANGNGGVQQQQGNMYSSNFVQDPFNKPLGANGNGGAQQQQGNMYSSNFVADPFNKPLEGNNRQQQRQPGAIASSNIVTDPFNRPLGDADDLTVSNHNSNNTNNMASSNYVSNPFNQPLEQNNNNNQIRKGFNDQNTLQKSNMASSNYVTNPFNQTLEQGEQQTKPNGPFGNTMAQSGYVVDPFNKPLEENVPNGPQNRFQGSQSPGQEQRKIEGFDRANTTYVTDPFNKQLNDPNNVQNSIGHSQQISDPVNNVPINSEGEFGRYQGEISDDSYGGRRQMPHETNVSGIK